MIAVIFTYREYYKLQKESLWLYRIIVLQAYTVLDTLPTLLLTLTSTVSLFWFSSVASSRLPAVMVLGGPIYLT